MKVAVTGASGFIGNRIVEKFYLGNIHEVVPVVHSYSSLTLPSRFALSWKVSDYFSVEDLSRAFAGCEVIVHAAFGSPLGTMSKAVYRAADRAGVRRLVILSSASVYNQNPSPGVTEDSPLPAHPATPYNANKIASDKIFRTLRQRGQTEIVFLMPGIVYGPKSQWIVRAAKQVMEGTAYLLDGGKGICNAIYIDNLVEAARLSVVADAVDRESFFISDAETITWADFYHPVLSAFGATFEDVHLLDESPVFITSVRARMLERVQVAAEARSIVRMKPLIPRGLKRMYKMVLFGALGNHDEETDNWAPPDDVPRPVVTPEMSLLQQCNYKLPHVKAERMLHYSPPLPFAEGMRRSIGWLKFAGYPVIS